MNDAGRCIPARLSLCPSRSPDDDDDDLLNSSFSRSCWLQLAEWRWVVCRGAGASAFVGTAIPDVAVLKIRQKVYEHRGGTGRSLQMVGRFVLQHVRCHRSRTRQYFKIGNCVGEEQSRLSLSSLGLGGKLASLHCRTMLIFVLGGRSGQ